MFKKNLTIISILVSIILATSLIFLVYPKECEIVSGDIHVYKNQCLTENHDKNLVTLSKRASYLDSTQQIDINAKSSLERLILDAEKDGMCLTVVSAYRSYDEQKRMYDAWEEKTTIAKPGQSEHQTGLAVDFAACPMKDGQRDDSIERLELEQPFSELPEYKWLVENAYEYSFEQSFRDDNQIISGYIGEPWHWKFINNEIT